MTAIERGEADWMLSYFAPPANRLSEIETRYASQVHADPLMSTDYFVMNTEVAPFDDVRVRRALNFAIDRGDIVQGGRRFGSRSPDVPGVASESSRPRTLLSLHREPWPKRRVDRSRLAQGAS